MKIYLFLLLFILLGHSSIGQKQIIIGLSYNMTVHLIFPGTISYWDVGSKDVLAEANGSILKLAPRKEFFETTGLTVKINENVWYTILLEYRKVISQWIFQMSDTDGRKMGKGGILTDRGLREFQDAYEDSVTWKAICNEILLVPDKWLDHAGNSMKVYLALTNIFIRRDKLYFSLQLGNLSNSTYTVNAIQLKIVNKTRLKRACLQEDVKKPVFIFNNLFTLPPGARSRRMILIYDMFTLTRDQKLELEMTELGGNRNFSFGLEEDLISKAIKF